MGSLIGSQFRNALAMRLNGTNQCGWVDNPSFKTDTSGCFSFWIKLDAVLAANGVQTIIGCGANDAANDAAILIGVRRVTATGTGTYLAINTRTTHGGTNNGVSGTTTPLAAGAWTYCEIETNGTTWAMRINGVTQTMTAWVGSNTGDWLGDISGASHKMVIGNNYNSNAISSYWFAGVVDEISYFDRTLTGPESTLLYNGGTPTNPHRVQFGSAWKSWWRCGDSRDTNAILYDEIGNGNDFTLVNMDASNYITP